jgi:predicted dehydrogenase
LEKPGAPTVAELEHMKALAAIQAVPCQVFVGYNKNVTRYVQEALAFSKTIKNSHVEFIHNNNYSRDELGECFERNSEGVSNLNTEDLNTK